MGIQMTQEERRARTRTRSFKQTKVIFNEGRCVYDAVMRNLTAYGATLTLAQPEKLPDEFHLLIVNENFTVPCRVRWRRADTVGVVF